MTNARENTNHSIPTVTDAHPSTREHIWLHIRMHISGCASPAAHPAAHPNKAARRLPGDRKGGSNVGAKIANGGVVLVSLPILAPILMPILRVSYRCRHRCRSWLKVVILSNAYSRSSSHSLTRHLMRRKEEKVRKGRET